MKTSGHPAIAIGNGERRSAFKEERLNHQQPTETGVTIRGREARSASLAARFTSQEAEHIKAAATAAGKPVAEWMREKLIAAAAERPQKPEFPGDVTLLAEQVAQHMLLQWGMQKILGVMGMPEAYFDAKLAEISRQKHEETRALLARSTWIACQASQAGTDPILPL